ncbi:helix-turn-helix domain-containing protein [Bacillus weihaiensis]|uniref:helix-turn-helix domain-containing protein n=1 Tax=Bacillus weihaiensis TaxID=1547283 RepID=UPI001F30BC72|nr:helix-turn-helix domain-containing protein [Bacillus weihaiensis]
MIHTLFKPIIAFECASCNTTFGVSTHKNEANCPNCSSECKSSSEGFMAYNQVAEEEFQTVKEVFNEDELLKADEVAKIIGKSKRVAYEIMDEKDFPLIRIRRSKRVLKSDFFEWLRQSRFNT